MSILTWYTGLNRISVSVWVDQRRSRRRRITHTIMDRTPIDTPARGNVRFSSQFDLGRSLVPRPTRNDSTDNQHCDIHSTSLQATSDDRDNSSQLNRALSSDPIGSTTSKKGSH